MDIARHRRRLRVALGLTAAALLVAAFGLAAFLGLRQGWGLVLFAAALVGGFASHGWLMLGLLREKSRP